MKKEILGDVYGKKIEMHLKNVSFSFSCIVILFNKEFMYKKLAS